MLTPNPHRSRPVTAWSVAVCALLVAASSALAQGTPKARYVVKFVDQQNYTHIHADTLYTHLGHNRGAPSGPQHDPARENILTQFKAGYPDAFKHAFVKNSVTYYNVVAELTGTVRPTDIYIIGGHYDSANNPGADDDASGVAAVIEIADILSQWTADATIRFIAFDAEEKGLWGSDAYAGEHAGENIRGMISLDMIAYRGTAGNKARVYGRSSSDSVKIPLAQACLDYGGITLTLGGQSDNSDHAPFEWRGKPACLLIEYSWTSNPNYHRPTDAVETPNYIDYPYAVALTKGTLGWLVDVAGVNPDSPLGDLNCDWEINNFDIDPFVLALTNPAGYKQTFPNCDIMNGDINGDGLVNNFDIDPFVKLLTP